MDISRIAEAILESRTPYSSLEGTLPATPGVYGVFVEKGSGLADTVIVGHPLDQPVYVGKSEQGLTKRHFDEHLAAGRSGSSTVRRTFGALLRKQLKLRPMRRGRTGKEQDFTSYKFDDGSEKRLSSWMEDNLAIGWWRFVGTQSEIRSLEKEVIAHFGAPLNLQNSSHPVVATVKKLRAGCADLARSA